MVTITPSPYSITLHRHAIINTLFGPTRSEGNIEKKNKEQAKHAQIVRTLQHCAKCAISGYWFSRAGPCPFIRSRLTVSEGKPYKQALAHGVLSIRHVFKRTLLIMHFLVLCHVSFITEVVEVASICLRVKFWNKWCSLGTQCTPVNFSKILMPVDRLYGVKALGL
jgi:hypothetical protein